MAKTKTKNPRDATASVTARAAQTRYTELCDQFAKQQEEIRVMQASIVSLQEKVKRLDPPAIFSDVMDPDQG